MATAGQTHSEGEYNRPAASLLALTLGGRFSNLPPPCCRTDFRFLMLICSIAPGMPIAPNQTVAAEASDAAAASVDSVADDGVLVLNDGGVLRGHVTREGDRYIVQRAKSRLEVAASNVALVSNSMADAYTAQQRQLPHTAEAHLGLGDWCLRYNLLPQAERELADARQLDPHSGKLELLKRRLDVATRAASPPKAIEDESEDANQESAADVARLEELAAALPPGAVERFTRKVQPLLVNDCTTAGCHQAGGKQVFQLDRAVLHGLSNRRTTLSNLAATLALVNRDAPQLSLLLTVPHAEHADMKQPILGSRQDQQFRQLEEWVAIVTGTPVPAEEKADGVKSADAVGKRTTAAQRRNKAMSSKSAHVEPPAFHVDDKGATAIDDAKAQANGTSDVTQANYEEPLPFEQLRQRTRPTVQLKTWEPRDEFDPEIFNRQSPQPAAKSRNSSSPSPSSPNH